MSLYPQNENVFLPLIAVIMPLKPMEHLLLLLEQSLANSNRQES
jgi:hypothetical protein